MTYNNASSGKIVVRLLLLDLRPGQWDGINACYYKHDQNPQLGKPLALGCYLAKLLGCQASF